MSRRTMRVAGRRAFASQSTRSPPSSSPSPSASPSILTGWDARWGVLERSLLRLPRLLNYQRQGLFAPSLSSVHHAFLYHVLNAPQRIDLDLPEFLRGAAIAAKRVIEDANSREFREFVVTRRRPLDRESVVGRMQAYCMPMCFSQLQVALHRALVQNPNVRLVDIDIDSVYLTRAMYARLTEEEYSYEFRGQHPLTAPADGDHDHPSVERLQLQVEVRTTEQVEQKDANAVSHLEQRNVYVAKLTSRVTTPEELDWRLSSIAVRTRGKPKLLARAHV